MNEPQALYKYEIMLVSKDAAVTYTDSIPMILRMTVIIVAVALIVWTWMPRQIGRVRMTFGLTLAAIGALAMLLGLIIHFVAPNFLSSSPATVSCENAPREQQGPVQQARDGSANSIGQFGGKAIGTQNNFYNSPSENPNSNPIISSKSNIGKLTIENSIGIGGPLLSGGANARR